MYRLLYIEDNQFTVLRNKEPWYFPGRKCPQVPKMLSSSIPEAYDCPFPTAPAKSNFLKTATSVQRREVNGLERIASSGTHLDLREMQGIRQLPPFRAPQVFLPLKGLLQPADLLRGESSPCPSLPPAGPVRRCSRAVPARALALVARGLVGAQPTAVGGCKRGKGQ